MRMTIVAMFGALALGISASPAAAAKPVATASPVAAVEAFHAALSRGDASAAADLLAEDVVIFEEGEAEASKSAYMASHLPADIAFLSQVKEEVTSRSQQQSGNLAWVISRGTLQGSHDGKPVSRQTTETMVLRRADGGWRIVHAHWSSSPLNKLAASPPAH